MRKGWYDEPDDRPPQPAGEEAPPGISNNEQPKPPADEGQEEQAPQKEQRIEEPAEEDAEMGTKGDQDRKSQADDTIEQNDQLPPKRGVGRPMKKVVRLQAERVTGCKGCRGESRYHTQACHFHQPTWQSAVKRV